MRGDDKQLESSNTALARGLRIVALTAAVAGLLAIGIGGQNERSPTLVGAAVAAKQADEGYRTGYLPVQFPAPSGEIEPPIETF
jgi:hypothetical protein